MACGARRGHKCVDVHQTKLIFADEYLVQAPWLVVVMKHTHKYDVGERSQIWNAEQSVRNGCACAG